MAMDQSPTANKTIVTVGVLSLAVLFSLKFILSSYYVEMTEAQARELSSAPEQLMKLRADQSRDLAQSPVPIDVAMKNLATSGRENAPAVVSPDSDAGDISPLIGWGKLAHDAGPFVRPMAVEADAGGAEGDAGELSADGGTAISSEGGLAAMTDASASNVVDSGATVPATHSPTTPGPTTPANHKDAGH